MNKTAYLVMVLDVSTNPPTFKGVGIFSEPSPSMTSLHKMRPIVVHQETSERGYHIADYKLRNEINTNPWLQWVKPYLTR